MKENNEPHRPANQHDWCRWTEYGGYGESARSQPTANIDESDSRNKCYRRATACASSCATTTSCASTSILLVPTHGQSVEAHPPPAADHSRIRRRWIWNRVCNRPSAVVTSTAVSATAYYATTSSATASVATSLSTAPVATSPIAIRTSPLASSVDPP